MNIILVNSDHAFSNSLRELKFFMNLWKEWWSWPDNLSPTVPSTVSNVRVTSVKSTEISLAWDAPSDPYSDIEMYEVRNIKGAEHCKVNYNL